LERCLDSIADLMDEIIIVDTGSTDNTIEIAKKYTDKIYHFDWIDDFSAARNFSFSKATMDYIYCADADEYLDKENHLQLKVLKENLFPEIEIVQMMYDTVSNDTVLNINREYRPKLYKRLREFTWIDPIHETVRIDPLVFDSDIVITHAPLKDHSGRDFSIFKKTIENNGGLSENVSKMYAIELYKCGKAEDFKEAETYFETINGIDDEYIHEYSNAVIVRGMRLNNAKEFEIKAFEAFDKTQTSELAFELGAFYKEKGELVKAREWIEKAISLDNPVLNVHVSGDEAYRLLIELSDKEEDKIKYQTMLDLWKNPEEVAV